MHIDGLKPILDTGHTVTLTKTEDGYLMTVTHPDRQPIECTDKDCPNDAALGLIKNAFTQDGQPKDISMAVRVPKKWWRKLGGK